MFIFVIETNIINIYNFLDNNKDNLETINNLLNLKYFPNNNIDDSKKLINDNFYDYLYETIYCFCLVDLDKNSKYTEVLKIAYYTYIQQLKLNKVLNISNELKNVKLVENVFDKLVEKLGLAWGKEYRIRFKDDMYNLINNYLNSTVLKTTKFDMDIYNFKPYKFDLTNYNDLMNFITSDHNCSKFLEKISEGKYKNKSEENAKSILKNEYHEVLYKSIYYYNFNKVITSLSFEEYLSIAFKTYSQQLRLNLSLGISNEIYDQFLIGCVIQEMVRSLYDKTNIKYCEGNLYNELKNKIPNNLNGILDEIIKEKNESNTSGNKLLKRWF